MADQHLLIDARAIAHPTAGGRGIGNYTLGLLEGLQAIGASFTALIEHDEDRPALDGVVDAASIGLMRRDEVRRSVTERSWYVATGLFLHPISFDPIPRVVSECGMPVASIMYDVIPYRDPARYLAEENAARQARLRAVLARTVDATLAISQFSAETAIEVLQLDPRRVRVIGAGVGSAFTVRAGIDRSTDVVAVTGADPRKNTERLIEAWAMVHPATRAGRRLLVVASAPNALLDRWRALAQHLGCGDAIEVHGAVDQVVMVDLLRRAALVVQPSLEEGFGLPVIEAAACGAPVICSDTSSLPEVLDEPSATFSPTDPASIARAIERGCDDVAHRHVLLGAGRRAVERWTWSRVAGDMVGALAELEPARLARRRPVTRVGLVTTPEAPGGIAPDVVRALADRVDVDVLIDAMASTEPVASAPAGGLGRYAKVHDFDHVVTVHGRSATARPPSLIGRIARRDPTHVWLCSDDVDPSVFGQARSAIVPTERAADEVRRIRPDLPVLVRAPSTGHAADAEALLSWLESDHRAAGATLGTRS